MTTTIAPPHSSDTSPAIGQGEPNTAVKLSQPWTREIVRGVFRVGSTYVGCYAVEEMGAYTFVDTGLPGYWEHLLGFLTSRHAPLSAVKAVVLTHHHVDHRGNAERLRKEAGAKVLVHHADLGLVMSKPAVPRWPMWKPRVLWYFLHSLSRGAAGAAPVLEASSFGDADVLDVPGHPRVIHTPGHTTGNVVISLEERDVLLVGDTLATLDLASGASGPRLLPRFMNEDHEQALASLKEVEALEAGWILPSHGLPWQCIPREAVRLARAVEAARR
jgi:glyoxylase-like metal-dependent hydrolase (beta-lactamase superfamily II)